MPLSNTEIFEQHLQYLFERLAVESMESISEGKSYNVAIPLYKEDVEGISFNKIASRLTGFIKDFEDSNKHLWASVTLSPQLNLSWRVHIMVMKKD